jgi:hypothetical protein
MVDRASSAVTAPENTSMMVSSHALMGVTIVRR